MLSKLMCLACLFGSLPVEGQGQMCACEKTGGCNFTDSCIPAGHCRKRNVALGKEAYLSSKFNESVKWNETSGPACLAVNGNSNSTFRPINRFPDSPNCVHSAGGDERPFWEVDLGQWFPIVGITVIGRDTQIERLTYLNLSVDGRWVSPVPSLKMIKIAIPFDRPVMGKKVRLTREAPKTDPYINLCEVQVWACLGGYFGPECQKPCGACKNKSPCHAITGDCPNGCDSGWGNPRCNQTCLEGYYGPDCIKRCGACKSNLTCDIITGNCSGGCDNGWQGPRCDQTDEWKMTVLVAGLAAGGVVIVILAAVIVMCCRRKSSTGSEIEDFGYNLAQLHDTDNQRNEGIDEVLGDTQNLYVNITHPQPYKEFLRHPDNSMDTDEPIYVNTVFK